MTSGSIRYSHLSVDTAMTPSLWAKAGHDEYVPMNSDAKKKQVTLFIGSLRRIRRAEPDAAAE
jgi:hypothetical protein